MCHHWHNFILDAKTLTLMPSVNGPNNNCSFPMFPIVVIAFRSIHPQKRLNPKIVNVYYKNCILQVEVKEHEFINDSGEIPALHCPVPFDYHPRTWIALFSVTFVALILCGIFFAFYFHQRRLSASGRYKFPFVVRV